jgi:serine/threonine-protein kinase
LERQEEVDVSDLSGALVRVGDVIDGRYEIEHLLGTGGMSLVFAARRLDEGDLRAIKILRPELLGSPVMVDQLVREARVGRCLTGEHVARAYDSGLLDGGAPYLVMEHLDGLDLHTVLQLHGVLSAEEALLHATQACEGLAEAHARGIVHRDLKPANLFLATRGAGAPRVKVIDFGLATMPGEWLGDQGNICGTPAYMAPEQVLLEPPRATADVWAMGVVLYELVTGRTPFCGGTMKELLTHIVMTVPTPPAALRSDLPAELDAVIMRCMERDPARRFADAGALKDALAKLGDGSKRTPRRGRCHPAAPSWCSTDTTVSGSRSLRDTEVCHLVEGANLSAHRAKRPSSAALTASGRSRCTKWPAPGITERV